MVPGRGRPLGSCTLMARRPSPPPSFCCRSPPFDPHARATHFGGLSAQSGRASLCPHRPLVARSRSGLYGSAARAGSVPPLTHPPAVAPIAAPPPSSFTGITSQDTCVLPRRPARLDTRCVQGCATLPWRARGVRHQSAFAPSIHPRGPARRRRQPPPRFAQPPARLALALGHAARAAPRPAGRSRSRVPLIDPPRNRAGTPPRQRAHTALALAGPYPAAHLSCRRSRIPARLRRCLLHRRAMSLARTNTGTLLGPGNRPRFFRAVYRVFSPAGRAAFGSSINPRPFVFRGTGYPSRPPPCLWASVARTLACHSPPALPRPAWTGRALPCAPLPLHPPFPAARFMLAGRRLLQGGPTLAILRCLIPP